MTLDRGVNDPVRFFIYAVEVLHTAGPFGAGGSASRHARCEPWPTRALSAMINEWDALPEHSLPVLEGVDRVEVRQ